MAEIVLKLSIVVGEIFDCQHSSMAEIALKLPTIIGDFFEYYTRDWLNYILHTVAKVSMVKKTRGPQYSYQISTIAFSSFWYSFQKFWKVFGAPSRSNILGVLRTCIPWYPACNATADHHYDQITTGQIIIIFQNGAFLSTLFIQIYQFWVAEMGSLHYTNHTSYIDLRTKHIYRILYNPGN